MSYLPIRVNTLRGDQKIDFDAYIKINDKHILYLRRGDSFEGERLQRLKSKKLKKMFIQPGDEANYRAYVQRNIEVAYADDSGKDIRTRAEIVHGQQATNAEEVFDDPTQANYQNAKDGVGRYIQFLQKNDDALGATFAIENNDRSVSHHGANVAALSVTLAQKLQISDPKQLQLLALGALLHDYGHQDSGLEIARPLKELSPEEMQTYLKHPVDGSSSLQDKKHFDQLVLNIVAQHEECIDGSGFPKGLHEREMDPLVIMVASANAFDRLMTLEGLSPKDAGKRLLVERVGKHPLNHLQILSAALKDVAR